MSGSASRGADDKKKPSSPAAAAETPSWRCHVRHRSAQSVGTQRYSVMRGGQSLSSGLDVIVVVVVGDGAGSLLGARLSESTLTTSAGTAVVVVVATAVFLFFGFEA
jgi:hypothetical protein